MNTSTVILIALATSMVTSVGTVYVVERYQIVPRQETPPAESVVPNLTGLSEADARSSAAAAALTLAVSGEEATAEAKPGTVLRQSLTVGQRVPPQSPVAVVLAQALPKVPSLAGMTVEAATARLKEAGYAVQVAGEVADATVPKGQIARQMPTAESAYVRGAAVTVQVSSGPIDVELPKLLGRSAVDAQKQLEALGLKPAVIWINQAETPEYIVLQQTPTAGTKVAPGTEVRLTVNR
jgi:beta-lactam-binding protein with PASTA domain